MAPGSKEVEQGFSGETCSGLCADDPCAVTMAMLYGCAGFTLHSSTHKRLNGIPAGCKTSGGCVQPAPRVVIAESPLLRFGDI